MPGRLAVLIVLALIAMSPALAAETDQDLDRRLALLSSDRGNLALIIAHAQDLADAFEARGRFAYAAKAISRGVEAATHMADTSVLVGLATRQLAMCNAAHDAHCEAIALVNLADVDAAGGRTELALERLERAVGLFRQTQDWTATLSARLNVAGARADFGDLAGALADLRGMEASLRQQGGTQAVNFDLALADVLIASGQPVLALAAAKQARVDASANLAKDDRFYFAPDAAAKSHSVEGRAFAKLGRAAEARAAFRLAFALAANPTDRFDTETDYVSALLDLGLPGEAIPRLRRLEVRASQAGDVAERDFDRLAAKIYAAAGLADQALPRAMEFAELQTKIYRASLTEAMAESANAVALGEQQVAAERLRKQNQEQHLAADRVLARTRLLAILILTAVLTSTGLIYVAVRSRERRARHAEMAATRARIAAEIHDTLLQGFIGVTMQVRASALIATQAGHADLAGRLDSIAAQAGASLAEARQAMASIHTPSPLQPSDLAALTTGWLKKLQPAPHVVLTFRADPDLPLLDRDRANEMHYVLREAVTNALRHSESSEICVELRARKADLEATIRDNGRGFDSALATGPSQDRWGLRLMHERMARIGGLLHIRTTPGNGTIVTATLPC